MREKIFTNEEKQVNTVTYYSMYIQFNMRAHTHAHTHTLANRYRKNITNGQH